MSLRMLPTTKAQRLMNRPNTRLSILICSMCRCGIFTGLRLNTGLGCPVLTRESALYPKQKSQPCNCLETSRLAIEESGTARGLAYAEWEKVYWCYQKLSVR